jgi:hypothetical protein
VPMFITGFPAAQKSFYMLKVVGDEEYTESCDLLMPGVGEIVGGSMRMTDTAQLLQGMKEHGIDPVHYDWSVQICPSLEYTLLRELTLLVACDPGTLTSESTGRVITEDTDSESRYA